MKVLVAVLLSLLGTAASHAIEIRDDYDDKGHHGHDYDYDDKDHHGHSYHHKGTRYFTLKVNDLYGDFAGFGVRLRDGYAIATPYDPPPWPPKDDKPWGKDDDRWGKWDDEKDMNDQDWRGQGDQDTQSGTRSGGFGAGIAGGTGAGAGGAGGAGAASGAGGAGAAPGAGGAGAGAGAGGAGAGAGAGGAGAGGAGAAPGAGAGGGRGGAGGGRRGEKRAPVEPFVEEEEPNDFRGSKDRDGRKDWKDKEDWKDDKKWKPYPPSPYPGPWGPPRKPPPPLPEFYVDDDTSAYTASKRPWQLYINSIDGALQYGRPGKLPKYAISVSFYHTGDNPLAFVDPTPSYFTWPSTEWIADSWQLCKIGDTGEYKVYASYFTQQGVAPANGNPDKSNKYCYEEELAAVNAY